MKSKIILAVSLFITVNVFSQQIGDGLAAPYLSDFSGLLKSGVYGGYGQTTGKVPDTSADWNHLFVIRHANTENNFQLQIGSSFTDNDRLFFRKIAGDLTHRNPAWTEIATRGNNNFTGNQTIDGNLGIGSTSPTHKLEVNGNGIFNGTVISSMANDSGGNIQLLNPTKNASGIATSWMIYNMTGGYGNSLQFWAYDNLSCAGGMCTNRFTIMDNGNVGIGSTNPTNKLDVNGTIHSKEVKVDMIGWSDFVFKKNYALPTLAEVEKHIKEKGHLENIPTEVEVLKNGINLGDMNAKLLQKIEELTLYSIQQNKKIEEQSKEIEKLKDLVLRVAKIEKEIKSKID